MTNVFTVTTPSKFFSALTVLLIMLNVLKAQALELKFVHNPIHGRFVMLQSLLGEPVGYRPMKKLVTSSRFNTPAFQAKLERWCAIDLSPSIKLEGYPATRMAVRPMQQHVAGLCIRVQSVSDLDWMLGEQISAPSKKLLLEALTDLGPIYDELVDKPATTKRASYLNYINRIAKKKLLGDQLVKIGQFLGADPDTSQVVLTGIVGLVGDFDMSTATPTGTSISAVTPVNDSVSAPGMIPVVMHELTHVLFSQQSLERQNQIDNWFMDEGKKGNLYAYEAYKLLNEQLATITGNGYAYEQLTGKQDATEWYHDPFINKAAKVMYAFSKPYLEAGKPLDQTWVLKSIQAIRDSIGNQLWTVGNLVNQLTVMTDVSAGPETNVMGTFRDLGHVSYFSVYTDIKEKDLDKAAESVATKLIALSGPKALSKWLTSYYNLPVAAINKLRTTPNELLVTRTQSGQLILIGLGKSSSPWQDIAKGLESATTIPSVRAGEVKWLRLKAH